MPPHSMDHAIGCLQNKNDPISIEDFHLLGAGPDIFVQDGTIDFAPIDLLGNVIGASTSEPSSQLSPSSSAGSSSS